MRRLRVCVDYGDREETKSFSGFPVRVGRGESTECRINLPHVSRFHARLELEGGRLILRDGGSRHGTFIRESTVRVPPKTAVDLALEGNEFQIGLIRVRAELMDDDDDPTLASEHDYEDGATLVYDARLDPEALDSEAARRPLCQDLEAYRHAQARLRRAVLDAVATLDVKRARALLVEVIAEFPELLRAADIEQAAAHYRVHSLSGNVFDGGSSDASRKVSGEHAPTEGRSSAA